jgi:murein DD-endopeptidase MepM/ murein hydrolase activator NlpD
MLCAMPQTLFAAVDTVRTITFPVGGNDYAYRNDFLEPRGGGTRQHQGNDIIAAKMTPLVAAVDGYVNFVANPQASWGYEVELQDDEGYTYDYLHVNNDTPGTDDGMGGIANAYANGIVRGVRVTRGQLLGWVGDSGNAEETVSHLHFEMHDPEHKVINPFFSLSVASGGKGVSSSVPSTGTVEPTFEERKASLRYIFSKTLRSGDESAEVRQLQLTLKAMKYFSYPVATGYFGEVTRSAVIAFQKQKGLSQTGEADQLTRRALNTELGTWDPNDYVPFYSAAEQRALKIAQLQQMILTLQAQLKQLRGY